MRRRGFWTVPVDDLAGVADLAGNGIPPLLDSAYIAVIQAKFSHPTGREISASAAGAELADNVVVPFAG